MKIERFLFGMFNGKIGFAKTDGVTQLVTDGNLDYLKHLKKEPPDKYLWLPTEQIIAFPHIITVEDDDGREFVQNETWLIPIHDYIQYTRNRVKGKGLFIPSARAELPEMLEPFEIG